MSIFKTALGAIAERLRTLAETIAQSPLRAIDAVRSIISGHPVITVCLTASLSGLGATWTVVDRCAALTSALPN